MKKKVLAAVLSSAIFYGTMQASASSNFFADVPADDWSYTAVNELISTGKIAGYNQTIPEGRIMSRLEMAMIVDEAMGNIDAFTPEEQATIRKLNEEYLFDIKKVRFINKMNEADEKDLTPSQGAADSDFTPEEKTKLKDIADRFSFNGFVRIRNDHYRKKDAATGVKTKTQRANHFQVQVATHYKINKDWQATADLTYRSSLSGFDEKSNKIFGNAPGENYSNFVMDTYLTGKMFKDALQVKFGKWYEWNPYGWGMDIDCDFAGAQLTYGKKEFKTFFTAGIMDLWDHYMGGDKDHESIASLRFFYPFSPKADINFGFASTSGMASRYQNPDKRALTYFVHGHYKFDNNWDLRLGTIASNAERDPNNPLAGEKTKKPGRWAQIQYKNTDLQKPGTYSLTLDYRYEPALTWTTVTDWCGLNEKFLRFGAAYVPAKNIVLDTFYTWAKDIDTGNRNDLYRFQAYIFF